MTIAKHKIMPCLWFDGQAEDAAKFYVSVFKNASIGRIARYTGAGKEVHGRPTGSVMTVEFTLDGQPFLGLNGGPHFKFSEAVSFTIGCDTQEEVDYYWRTLSEGGEEGPCGWLKDKFGLSWQVVPSIVPALMAGSDAKADRVMGAIMTMKKIDVDALKQAADV